MTYLECVNKVLRRLRENEVSTVNETPYSQLIGDLVNVVKVEIEDSWTWSALRTTLSVTTSSSVYNYTLTGSSTKLKVLDVTNDTDEWFIENQTSRWFTEQFLGNNAQTGSPYYYNFNGVDSNGDTKVDFYPIPDGVYTISFKCVVPQSELTADATRILIPSNLLIEGVLARAISERGDDGGYAEQEQRYRNLAADLIAVEASHHFSETIWMPV